MKRLFVGTSGYRYWPGDVFPPQTSSDGALRLYAEKLPSVELNRTFYQLPREGTLRKFQTLVPQDFVWAVKIWRRISHEKRLVEVSEDWAVFLNRLEAFVGPRGVFLLQLPKSFPFDLPRLESFLKQVPKGLRLAVEFRAVSWFSAKVYRLLEKYNTALVGVGAPGVPCVLDIQTASFSYYRLHGPRQWYKDRYTEAELEPFETAARKSLKHGDVYLYFDNTIGGHAYWNALDVHDRALASA